jgi:hypothetical protein
MFSLLLKPARKALFPVFFLLTFFAFFGCSESSSDSDSSLPLTGPATVVVTPGNGELTLQWTTVAAAQGVAATYIVYYNTVDDPATALRSNVRPIVSGNHVGVTLTGLQNETEYFIWVKAVFGSLGEADLSPVSSGTPIPPAATPTGIVVSEGANLLLLNWLPSARASSYTVAYSTTSGATPPASATKVTVYTNAALLIGLTNGTTYHIWIMGSNTAGDSDYSTRVSGVPAAPASLPDIPGVLTVEPGNKRLKVSWDMLASATGYQLYWTDGASVNGSVAVAPSASGAAEVSYTILGLLNGTSYDIHLVALNANGNSTPGAVVNAVPAASEPLDFSDYSFSLGIAVADYIFAEDLPPSPFYPDGRPNTDRLTRSKEAAVGDLFTDGIAWYVRDRYPEENVDFVLLNGGLVEGAIPQGTVTLSRIATVVDPDARQDKLVFLTLKGADVKDLFNNNVAQVVHMGRGGSGTGAFGMVSKEVRYTLSYPVVDMSTTGPNWDPVANKYREFSSAESRTYYYGEIEPGTLKINGGDFVDTQNYRIATTDYLANGLDGYLVFPAKGENRKNTGIPAWYGVAEYIYDQGRITPYIDGRVFIKGGIPMGGPEAQPPYK